MLHLVDIAGKYLAEFEKKAGATAAGQESTALMREFVTLNQSACWQTAILWEFWKVEPGVLTPKELWSRLHERHPFVRASHGAAYSGFGSHLRELKRRGNLVRYASGHWQLR